MTRLIAIASLIISIWVGIWVAPGWAADISNGAKVFNANCSACHIGGRNVVMANKTLKKEALEKYGMYSLEAIKTQIAKGKNAMPAFANRLSTKQIEDVSTYVLQQAESGW
ncbi:MAG TPA: c-type cytochrome [Leptolyngbyaceae cyanobacterium M33_DOE_097]|uniref:Cytochrome c6 n=1 Tax=Oscillatoriales cyanobacterium SpSt-418 TaxID=2282169 RepID=A0A7C3KGK9_9CYAN|nr:c-type cytochrome [Leptolyngbyaceae cyanobacterium M33_DOE_097]